MKENLGESIGIITLSFHVQNNLDPVIIKIPEASSTSFMRIAQNAANHKEPSFGFTAQKSLNENLNQDMLSNRDVPDSRRELSRLMGVIEASVVSNNNSNSGLVSNFSTSDDSTNTLDGGDNMETRIAVLEADVAHIKNDISGLKEDIRTIASSATDAKRDTAVLLQKSLDFDSSLSKKPSVDYFEAKFAAIETKISDVKVWILGVLLASFAMPTIFFLLNLYLKK